MVLLKLYIYEYCKNCDFDNTHFTVCNEHLTSWHEKFWQTHLEVVLNPLGTEALGDHYDSSLDVEAQSHLGTALVVLFPNGYKQLILQQGRTFHIYPRPETEANTNDAWIETLPEFLFNIPNMLRVWWQ